VDLPTTDVPTKTPTDSPITGPSRNPSAEPSNYPSMSLTKRSTNALTQLPTRNATRYPIDSPSDRPTGSSVKFPVPTVSSRPSHYPTRLPSRELPAIVTDIPSTGNTPDNTNATLSPSSNSTVAPTRMIIHVQKHGKRIKKAWYEQLYTEEWILCSVVGGILVLFMISMMVFMVLKKTRKIEAEDIRSVETLIYF